MFRLEIQTDNDAFKINGAEEIRTILKDIANQLRYGETSGKVRDTNGNTVGEWSLTD